MNTKKIKVSDKEIIYNHPEKIIMNENEQSIEMLQSKALKAEDGEKSGSTRGRLEYFGKLTKVWIYGDKSSKVFFNGTSAYLTKSSDKKHYCMFMLAMMAIENNLNVRIYYEDNYVKDFFVYNN